MSRHAEVVKSFSSHGMLMNDPGWEDAVDELLALANKRGASPSQLLSLMVRSFDRKPIVVGLHEVLSFGKYRGEICEVAIRADPRYFNWVVKEAEGVKLTPDAELLVAELWNGVK